MADRTTLLPMLQYLAAVQTGTVAKERDCPDSESQQEDGQGIGGTGRAGSKPSKGKGKVRATVNVTVLGKRLSPSGLRTQQPNAQRPSISERASVSGHGQSGEDSDEDAPIRRNGSNRYRVVDDEDEEE